MSTKSKYTLTIDLNALNHLGINLYSSIPAVISEVVANSWDADAEHVWIDINPQDQTITIRDDGFGMDEDDINDKYLKVGYSKREKDMKITPIHGRHVMGRKGIGKLSLFSIAKEIEVHSAKLDTDATTLIRNGFIMNSDDIQKEIGKSGKPEAYHPRPVPTAKLKNPKGTLITLRDLKARAALSEGFLRTRLARRFSVIGAESKFEVVINGKEIGIEDRDYFKKVEFVWYFGDDSQKYADLCTNATRREKLPAVVNADEDYKVTGWIGTFDERKSIEEGNNSIVVLAWGKLIHEDILNDIDEGGLFTKYLIGEVRADFVDFDDKLDIATSDRQRLRQDDPRFRLLKSFVQDAVKKNVKLSWGKWRGETAEEKARQNPAIDEWYKQLGKDHRKFAQSLFAKIEQLALPDEQAKRELYRQSILAFETLAMKNNLSALENITSDDEITRLIEVLGNVDEIEASHYYQIVKARIQVLTKLEDLKAHALEKVLQEHIFDHLWLLDPSWERASTDAKIESRIGTEFAKVDAKLTQEERDARLDIKYRTAAGKHIVIELKKYDRVVKATELAEQIDKYQGALRKVLSKEFPDEKEHRIEFICILGSPPTAHKKQAADEMLKAQDARFITYDQLLNQTRDSYRDYLDASAKVTRIEKLVAAI